MEMSEENELTSKYFSKPYLIPKFQITIDERLEFTLATEGYLFPDDHQFFKLFKRSVRNSEMHRIFFEIQSYQSCDGVKDSVGNTSVNVHSIPCEINFQDQFSLPTKQKLSIESQTVECF